MTTYLFDCETNGLLDKLDRVHSLVLKNVYTGEIISCSAQDPDYSVKDGVRMLMDATQIIAHNAIGFDVPALTKVYPWFTVDPSKVQDTLTISRLIWTNLRDEDSIKVKKGKFPANLVGSHSLEAWGHRLGEHKGNYQGGWDYWSEEMQNYCVQDVGVLERLWRYIAEQKYSQQAIELEHKVQWIVRDQELRGFAFDTDLAIQLMVRLNELRDKLDIKLQDIFDPWWSPNGETTPKRTVKFKDPKRGNTTAGAPYTKIKLTEFNPGSRMHIANRLQALYGWKPSEYTPNGQPKVDEVVLKKLDYPEAKLLAEYFMIQKRLGQLSDGKNAWLKMETNGRIHGRVNTNGAATGRMTHSKPNITQVPSVRKPFGGECRSMFISGDGKKIVGADVSGLELRMLAHYMAFYDEGEYGKVILESDIHTHNQRAAGLKNREQAKTFIYGYMYGAGDIKLGEIVNPNASNQVKRRTGMRLRRQFEKEIPALGKLTEAVKSKYNTNGSLIGLDGRALLVRSEHSALNMLLQGGGAIICKQWMVEADQMLRKRGLHKCCGQVATVHDELQFECDEGVANEVGELLVDAIVTTGSTFDLRIPLSGEYKVGDSWAETH